jgi:uncharacterized membrane protein YdbT with pleckstrin-like domain
MDEQFEWLSLDEGEAVIWSGQPTTASAASSYAVGIVLIPVVIGIFIIVSSYLLIQNTDYVVTTNGLYKKTGVLSRDVQKIDFEKVQNISFSQGVIGTQLGYGSVNISTAGGSGIEMRFSGIEDPKAVQELITKRTKRVREDEADETVEKADVLEDVLTELRAIRATLEESSAVESTPVEESVGDEPISVEDSQASDVPREGEDSGPDNETY